MAENLTSTDILNRLALPTTEKVTEEFSLAGTVPQSIIGTEIKKTITTLGLTPIDFSKTFSSVEFDFEALKNRFSEYCKGFGEPLSSSQPSRALEFAAKILFEYGPFMRTEKKIKGDKAIRFRFPYKKTTDSGE
ncbi:unnamed protein product [Parnassius apollo]|uniref:(apollo) hypothetical protein n=1 Tax=Parnassius apollo TaxID=110799 RepID=A0A8S3W224_PARAO|nr:unnamed protein product [Parnassius apollo]